MKLQNGREAVERLGISKRDLIVVDLVMRVLDGLSATREIIDFLPSAPVLMNNFHTFAIELEAKKSPEVRSLRCKCRHRTSNCSTDSCPCQALQASAPESETDVPDKIVVKLGRIPR